MVGPTVDAKPPGHDLLERHELDEIVGNPKKEVIASHDLKPLKLACSDLENRQYVAGDILVGGSSIGLRKVNG